MADDPQLRLFPVEELATERPCVARPWLRCDGCGGVEPRTLSCVAPCVQCPWGPLRVSAAVARLPRVRLRHWVLVPPARWARVLPGHPDAAQRFRRAVVRRVVEGVEVRAKRELGHARGKAGALAVLHTSGADLRARAHVHLIATDGVFVPASHGRASFVPLREGAGDAELRELARAVGAAARDALPEPERLVAESTGGRVKHRGGPPQGGQVVEARGAEVFVGEPVEAHDRRGAETLAGYVVRPPLAGLVVEEAGRGDVQLGLRGPARDGAAAVRMPRAVFEERVRAVVRQLPQRRVSLHGVLAPGSGVRWRGDGVQLRLLEAGARVKRGTAREGGGERCACGGRMRVVAAERG